MKEPLVHPDNPELKPLEVYPIFPNMKLWPNSYTQIVVDRESLASQPEELKVQAIMKLYQDKEQPDNAKAKFFAFLIPKKRKREDEGDESQSKSLKTEENGNEQEYEWIREFQYDIKAMNSPEFGESYFFIFNQQEMQAQYCELSSRLSLAKRNISSKSEAEVQKPIKFSLFPGELNEKEKRVREDRMTILATYNSHHNGSHKDHSDEEEEIKDDDI